jgi:hypothetical protein
MDDKAIALVDNYETFLASLNDAAVRSHLENLSETAVYEDDTFLKLRDVSHQMQSVLKAACLDGTSSLKDFTCEYGVF